MMLVFSMACFPLRRILTWNVGVPVQSGNHRSYVCPWSCWLMCCVPREMCAGCMLCEGRFFEFLNACLLFFSLMHNLGFC